MTDRQEPAVSPPGAEAPSNWGRIDDEVLVRLAQEALPGDYTAFEELVRRHEAGVIRNCVYLAGSEETAEDLAQEVFLKAFFAIPRFEGRSQFGTWVQRIKVNHCLDHLRKGRGKMEILMETPPEGPPVEPRVSAEQAGLEERVHVALESLPISYRIPLVMCDADGYAYQEIADELGLSLSATKMRIKRAREMFRESFDRTVAGESRSSARSSADRKPVATESDRGR